VTIAAHKWCEALLIALLIASLFVLFALLVLAGLLPGEFIHTR
jgi:hypothetical protein